MFDEYFSRHFPLSSIGKDNQYKLKMRKVFIAGMGGLGNSSSELLASLGVGNIRAADFDVIEVSNLPRQRLFRIMDKDKAKVEVAGERLLEKFPFLNYEPQVTKIDPLNVKSLLNSCDVIVDALDKFSTRRIINRAAFDLKIPYVFAGAIAESANIMTFTYKEESPCLECAIGSLKDDDSQSCEILGVHPSILQIATAIQASEVLKLLLDQKPVLENKMLIIDLDDYEFHKVNIKKKDDCRICNIDYNHELDGGELGETKRGYRKIPELGDVIVTSLCGRDTLIIDPKFEIKWSFDEIQQFISKKYNVIVSGNNYITFSSDSAQLSLLPSGVATIRGSGSSTNAVYIYGKFFETLKTSKIKDL